jgi:hypothetical protein
MSGVAISSTANVAADITKAARLNDQTGRRASDLTVKGLRPMPDVACVTAPVGIARWPLSRHDVKPGRRDQLAAGNSPYSESIRRAFVARLNLPSDVAIV